MPLSITFLCTSVIILTNIPHYYSMYIVIFLTYNNTLHVHVLMLLYFSSYYTDPRSTNSIKCVPATSVKCLLIAIVSSCPGCSILDTFVPPIQPSISYLQLDTLIMSDAYLTVSVKPALVHVLNYPPTTKWFSHGFYCCKLQLRGLGREGGREG